MSTKKYLFPTDLSELSTAAMEYAAALARDSQGELLIVHIEEPGAIYVIGGTDHYGAAMPGSKEVSKLLEAVKPDDANVRCHHRLLHGNPADEIVRLAEEEEVDAIVMATHGRSGLTHLLMGSVAEAVVRRAGCPVLTFKPEQTAAQQVMLS
jgi:universal stress protein A